MTLACQTWLDSANEPRLVRGKRESGKQSIDTHILICVPVLLKETNESYRHRSLLQRQWCHAEVVTWVCGLLFHTHACTHFVVIVVYLLFMPQSHCCCNTTTFLPEVTKKKTLLYFFKGADLRPVSQLPPSCRVLVEFQVRIRLSEEILFFFFFLDLKVVVG